MDTSQLRGMNLGSFAASYVNTIITVAEQKGLSRKDILNFLKLDEEFLQVPIRRVCSQQVIALYHYVIRESGDDYFGLAVGESFKPGTFDILGYAVMCSKKLSDAILLNQRYQPLNQTLGITRLNVIDGRAEKTWLPVCRDDELMRPVEEAVMAGYAGVGRWITWWEKHPIFAVHFRHSRPKSLAAYERVFECPVYFDQPETKMVFDAAFLETPLQQANGAMAEMLQLRLDERLQLLRQGDRTTSQLACFIQSVLPNKRPSLREAADSLGYSERTLKRRLQDENTSFSEVLDNVRRDSAKFYLSKSWMSIRDVAQLLGFSDQSSFTHAFKSWYDQSPGQFRQQMAAVP